MAFPKHAEIHVSMNMPLEQRNLCVCLGPFEVAQLHSLKWNHIRYTILPRGDGVSGLYHTPWRPGGEGMGGGTQVGKISFWNVHLCSDATLLTGRNLIYFDSKSPDNLYVSDDREGRVKAVISPQKLKWMFPEPTGKPQERCWAKMRLIDAVRGNSECA